MGHPKSIVNLRPHRLQQQTALERDPINSITAAAVEVSASPALAFPVHSTRPLKYFPTVPINALPQ
jgi:hypothetical protein